MRIHQDNLRRNYPLRDHWGIKDRESSEKRARALQQLATGDNLSAITKSVGGDNQKGVQSALSMALPLLMGYMANSASTPSGANMLTNMLGQMGGSNPADNLGSYLSNPQAAGRSGMLNTLLGSKMDTIQNAISQKTGLPPCSGRQGTRHSDAHGSGLRRQEVHRTEGGPE